MNRLWRMIRRATISPDTPPVEQPIRRGTSPADAVTAGEIVAVTGGSPVGPGRRNGDGMSVDVGTLAICEWQLTNGDEFLVTLIRANDRRSANLAVDRQAEEMEPLAGVGERALVRVQKYAGTKSELGVTALHGTYVLSLTHTSTHGVVDPGPLTSLLERSLGRLG